MILDMNINLDGINEKFLKELEEFIEDMRVEYFIINPVTKEEIERAQVICKESQRFHYTLSLELKELKDENCVAFKITQPTEIMLLQGMPVVVNSDDLNNEFIENLNSEGIKGVVLNAKERDNQLINFIYSISHTSLKNWTKKGITDTDYNKLALQSDYPVYSYDELSEGLLKEISDLTFRAEQTIAAGGTRTALRTFGLF